MKIGFIGLGNMAGAIIRGLYSTPEFSGSEILGYNPHPEKARVLEKECGVKLCASNVELVQACSVVVLAVKPQKIDGVLEEIRPFDTYPTEMRFPGILPVLYGRMEQEITE